MSGLRIILIEDDVDYLDYLKLIIEENPEYTVVGMASDFESGLALVNSKKPDLVISDINLNSINSGIDIASLCDDKNIPFVFITSYDDPEFFIQSNEVNYHAFLIKPFHKLTLQSTIHNLVKMTTLDTSEIPTVLTSGSEVSLINVHDILWMESDRNYTTISTSDRKIVLRNSLSSIIKKFNSEKILRVHKSFAVSTDCIKSINYRKNTISIGKLEIPIGRSFKARIKTQMSHLDNGIILHTI